MSARKHRAPRVPVLREVRLFAGSERLHGTLRNLSETGALVAVDAGPPPAPFLRLQLKVDENGTESGSESGTWIHADGLVVRQDEGGAGALWGIRFVELSETAHSRLRRFVAARQTVPRSEPPARSSPGPRRPGSRPPADRDPDLQQLYAEAVNDVDDEAPRLTVVKGRRLL